MAYTIYPTAARLRGVAPANGALASTHAYAVAGDHGGGLWVGATGGSAGQYVDNSATILVPERGDGSAAWIRQFTGPVSFGWFGAVGGNATADTAAYKALCRWVNGLAVAAGGTDSAPGTVGVEIDFPDRGDAYIFDFTSETFGADVQFHNARGLKLKGHQTRIKIVDGAQIGAGPLDDESGFCFYFQNCQDLTVEGFDLDGNLENLSIGDTDGRGLGIGLYKVHDCTIRNCSIHDFGTDGIFLWSRVANDPTRCENVTLVNVRCSRNRRQGMSIAAARNTTCINCQFNETGQGASDTAPRAGVDLEPSFSTDFVKGTTFVGCQFLNNKGAGFVSDTLASQVSDTTFTGCEIEVLWSRHSSISVHGGLITGYMFNYYGTIHGARLELNDEDSSYGVSSVNDDAPMLLDGCEIIIDCTGNFAGISLDGTGGKTIRNSTVELQNTDQLTGTFACIFRDSETLLENVTFADSGTAKAVYLSITDARLRNCRSLSDNISFDGLNGRKYLGDSNGFLVDSSTSNSFRPSSDRQSLTGARTINAFNGPAGDKVVVRASGVSVTITDNGNFTPLSSGDLVLADGDEAVLYFTTGSTCRQLERWQA